ncbi:CBS domain-containing protein [Streptomyces sp. NPDC048650]|uniref:CBS domain-containing protein n=1 Tax=unclassified Streptomyces TaxID=2593676 RepID=UPI003718AFAE
MRHRRVGSIMTGDVVAARRETPADELARWLTEFDINGVPVVDADDKVLGIVSATDLARVRRVSGARANPVAALVMSAPAHTIRADDSVVRAARLMSASGVERLPVVDEEARLVGMVTRRDVLRIFTPPDADIRDQVVDEIVVRTLELSPRSVDVSVHDGVVTLVGQVATSGQAVVVVRMVRQVDGVVAVIDRLAHRHETAYEQPV